MKILRNASCVTRLINLILIIKKNYIKNPLRIINIIFISTYVVGFKYYFCLLTKPNKLFYYIFIYLRFNSHLWSICEPLIVTNVIIITRLFFPFISFLEIILAHNTIFSPLIHIFCMIRDESYGLYKKKYILSIVKFFF